MSEPSDIIGINPDGTPRYRGGGAAKNNQRTPNPSGRRNVVGRKATPQRNRKRTPTRTQNNRTKRIPNVTPRGRNNVSNGNGANAVSITDAKRKVSAMLKEKIPGTNEPKWSILPTSGQCIHGGFNMCEPTCPGGMYTFGFCNSSCTGAYGTEEQIEEQCGDAYGNCSGWVKCFHRNMTN
jgi:hypothetical protein